MARFAWCDEHMTFEKKGEDCFGKRQHESRLMIMPDIAPFVSTVDGKLVTGRAALREHNKRHNVTNVADFKNTWKAQAAERAKVFQGTHDRQERAEAVARAFEKVRNK